MGVECGGVLVRVRVGCWDVTTNNGEVCYVGGFWGGAAWVSKSNTMRLGL